MFSEDQLNSWHFGFAEGHLIKVHMYILSLFKQRPCTIYFALLVDTSKYRDYIINTRCNKCPLEMLYTYIIQQNVRTLFGEKKILLRQGFFSI